MCFFPLIQRNEVPVDMTSVFYYYILFIIITVLLTMVTTEIWGRGDVTSAVLDPVSLLSPLSQISAVEPDESNIIKTGRSDGQNYDKKLW